MKTLPNLLYERIQERHQTGDAQITLKLLTNLHEKHEKFISTLPQKTCIIVDILKQKTNSEIVDEIFKKLCPLFGNFIENP